MKNNEVRKFLKKCFKSMEMPITGQSSEKHVDTLGSYFTSDGKMILVNTVYCRESDATILRVFFQYEFQWYNQDGIYNVINRLNSSIMDVATLSIDKKGFIVSDAILYNTSEVLDKKQFESTMDRLLASGLHFYDLIALVDTLVLTPEQALGNPQTTIGQGLPQSKVVRPKDLGTEKDLRAMKSCFRKEGLPIILEGQERHIEKDGRYSQAFNSGFKINSVPLLIDTQLIPAVRAVAIEILGFPKVENESLSDVLYLFNHLHRTQKKGQWTVSPQDNKISLKGFYFLSSGPFHKLQFRSFIQYLIKSCRILYPLVTNPTSPGKNITEIYADFFDTRQEDFEWLVMG